MLLGKFSLGPIECDFENPASSFPLTLLVPPITNQKFLKKNIRERRNLIKFFPLYT